MRLQFRSELFRHCLLCGGYPPYRHTEICERCWSNVQAWFANSAVSVDLLSGVAHCGFSWKPGDIQSKVSLTYGLKGQARHETWLELGRLFVQAHQIHLANARYFLLPVPGRNQVLDDHGWRWARAIAPWVGGHVLNIFRHNSAKSQKKMNRQDRFKRSFNVDARVVDWLHNQVAKGWKIALVDDVVTTGATARAAWQAVYGLPAQEIWALAYRLPTVNLAKPP